MSSSREVASAGLDDLGGSLHRLMMLMPPAPRGTQPPLLSSRDITCAFTCTRKSSLHMRTQRRTPLHYFQREKCRFNVCCLTPSTPAVPNCCCLKGPVPYWSNPPFLVFDIPARAPECHKLKMVGQTSMAKSLSLIHI